MDGMGVGVEVGTAQRREGRWEVNDESLLLKMRRAQAMLLLTGTSAFTDSLLPCGSWEPNSDPQVGNKHHLVGLMTHCLKFMHVSVCLCGVCYMYVHARGLETRRGLKAPSSCGYR